VVVVVEADAGVEAAAEAVAGGAGGAGEAGEVALEGAGAAEVVEAWEDPGAEEVVLSLLVDQAQVDAVQQRRAGSVVARELQSREVSHSRGERREAGQGMMCMGRGQPSYLVEQLEPFFALLTRLFIFTFLARMGVATPLDILVRLPDGELLEEVSRSSSGRWYGEVLRELVPERICIQTRYIRTPQRSKCTYSHYHYYEFHYQYGNANNSSRPGGQLVQAPFQSKSQNTTLHIIADRATTTSLIESITSACSQNLNTTAISASQFDPNTTNAVKPEQAIQYYRASSVVLTLDGYNNTAALDGDPNAPPVPLPGWVDRGLLDCVNSTIGAEVPLVDGSSSSGAPVGMGGVDMHGVVAVVLCLLAVLQVV
jgi:hypothetical protein